MWYCLGAIALVGTLSGGYCPNGDIVWGYCSSGDIIRVDLSETYYKKRLCTTHIIHMWHIYMGTCIRGYSALISLIHHSALWVSVSGVTQLSSFLSTTLHLGTCFRGYSAFTSLIPYSSSCVSISEVTHATSPLSYALHPVCLYQGLLTLLLSYPPLCTQCVCTRSHPSFISLIAHGSCRVIHYKAHLGWQSTKPF